MTMTRDRAESIVWAIANTHRIGKDLKSPALAELRAEQDEAFALLVNLGGAHRYARQANPHGGKPTHYVQRHELVNVLRGCAERIQLSDNTASQLIGIALGAMSDVLETGEYS